MSKATIVLITGAGGDAQGWGNMQVTEAVRDAIIANGHDCRIVLAENRKELEQKLAEGPCTLAWSSLYFFSDREDIIGIPPDAVWVADVLDELGIPYIGPSAQSMKNLISSNRNLKPVMRFQEVCMTPPSLRQKPCSSLMIPLISWL